MALVNALLAGLQLFSDIGIGPALIQNKREDTRFLNTVWTIGVVRGLVLCVIAVAVAGPYAAFYDQPVLASLVQVAALTVAIRALASTSVFTERRHLRVKRPALVHVAAQLAGAAAMVGYAWFTHSVWSLVIGGIVSSIMFTLLTHVWLPGVHNRFGFERTAARALFSFGAWIFLSTLASVVSEQMDRLMIGKMTDMSTLGVYSIAAMLATAPVGALRGLNGRVLFPLYSRVHYSSSSVSRTFGISRWPVLVLGGWVAAGLIGGGPTIVRLLYDSRYWEAGWMLQILVSGLWFGRVLEGPRGAAILAVGRSDWLAAAAYSKVFAMAVLIPLGYWVGGFPGAIGGLAASELARYVLVLVVSVKMGFDERREELLFTTRVALSAAAGAGTVTWLTALGVSNPALHALAVFVVVTVFWAWPLSILVGRVRRREPLFQIDC